MFARLSVFSGSFAAADATAVVTGDGIDTWDVIELIGSLVAKSMLTTDEAADGSTRYRQLETLRQYARDRLDDIGDPDVWRRRHAEHYAEFAEQAGAGLLGSEELAWRPRADRRARQPAQRGGVEPRPRGSRRPRARACASSPRSRNEANSGRSPRGRLVGRACAPLRRATTPERRAAVLSAASWNALLGGDLELGRDRAHAGVATSGCRGFVRAGTYVLLSYIAAIQQDYDRVTATLAEGLAVTEADRGRRTPSISE